VKLPFKVDELVLLLVTVEDLVSSYWLF